MTPPHDRPSVEAFRARREWLVAERDRLHQHGAAQREASALVRRAAAEIRDTVASIRAETRVHLGHARARHGGGAAER